MRGLHAAFRVLLIIGTLIVLLYMIFGAINMNLTTPVHPPTSTPVPPPTSRPVHQSTSTPVHPSTNTPVYPSTSTPVYPSTSTPVYPSTSVPVHPSTSSAPVSNGSHTLAQQTPSTSHPNVTPSWINDATIRISSSIKNEMKDVKLYGNKTLDDFLVGKGGNPLRTLIVGGWRTGSSFSGQVLQSHPGTNYWYEPVLRLKAGQIRKEPLGDKANFFIREMFKCQLEMLGEDYVKQLVRDPWFLPNNFRVAQYCNRVKGICEDAQLLSKICRLFPFHVMKVVRYRLDSVHELLDDTELNLKVLYLVRDPRAVIHSRMQHKWCVDLPDCSDPSILCNDMTREFHIAQALLDKHPKKFRVVRYETLVDSLVNQTQDILRFIGLNFDSHVQNFLQAHMSSDDGQPFSTYRYSKTAATHWMTDLKGNFSRAQAIQDKCKHAMILWGYDMLTQEDIENKAE